MLDCTGVVYWGPVLDMSGYGNVARNYLKALEHAKIPVFIQNNGAVYKEIGNDTIRWMNELSTSNLGDRITVIQHCDPSLLAARVNCENMIKRIGITLFETDRIATEWAGLCNTMDEVWVPSQFNVDTFVGSGVAPWKLKIVPYAIDSQRFNINTPKANILEQYGGQFKFLFASGFDYRKGYDLLIRSYCREFTADDNVVLIIKLYVPYWSKEQDIMSELSSYVPSGIPVDKRPKVDVILEPMDNDRMVRLYQSCDAFISPERASGWGMPEMECMALGKPVASIHWGGSTEFMTFENSFPIVVENELEPVDMRLQTARPSYAGHMWAKVKDEEVQKVMREMYENKGLRDRKATLAAKEISDKFSIEAVAEKLREIL